MAGKLFFTLRYWFDNPPWDTGISPPELLAYLAVHPPGRALDLGCGTGTNVLTMAEYGWKASGIDFVSRAIQTARQKARRKGSGERAIFYLGDVLSPDILPEQFDLVLDIGCFHSFSGSDVERYLHNVLRWLVPGGSLLLYTHLQTGPVLGHGSTEQDLAFLGAKLQLIQRQDGEEYSRPSAWLEYRR
jgi:cyclopropane fatty-acyl-phospholipid synthase-like methyltransferase